MKLSNKILNYFVIAIVIVLIITILSTTLAFRLALDNYLEKNVEEEFKAKANDLSNLYNLNSGLNSTQLSLYAQHQNINIKLYTIENNLIAQFDGIKNEAYSDKKLVSKIFNLLSPDGQKLGIIELSYLEDLYLYNNTVNTFYNAMTKSYAVIIVVAVLLGLLLMMYFTKKLVNPISEMNEFTKKIKAGQYSSLKENYNIYEIDELSTNLNYLSSALSLQENYRLNYAQDIAHELRTPLTNLLLHLEGIRDEIIEADPNTIKVLIAEVNRLNKMVDNLHLSFDKIEDSSKLKLEDNELKPLLEQIISSFMPKLKDKNISISTNLDSKTHAILDKDKFVQVINNLISNAIKAVNQNGKIEIILQDFRNRIVLSIKDDGIGMKSSDLEHIFERFYRVDSTRNRATGGHGLGLAIAKSYIEMMGGKIIVNSKEGQGSEFIITLNKKN